MGSKYRYATVCSSNQNRSMEAHCFLLKKGFNVKSFGTGAQVKLPGPAMDQPNTYEFGVPYDQMYRDLSQQDHELYTQNGVLMMLDRNRKTKKAPERLQETDQKFDVIITCEERVFDQAIEAFEERESETMEPVHIINIDIRDNHEDATIGSFHIHALCQMIEDSDDLDSDMELILEKFQRDRQQDRILHHIAYY